MREHKMFYVYIMASRSHQLYIGFTSDIEMRSRQHKEHRVPGWTAKYNCERLVWFERFRDPSVGIAREKQLKRWARAKKIALIETQNPTWEDLSEPWGKPVEMYQWPKENADPSTTSA